MMILAMMMVMTISANAMSYNAAKNEALFLSDKMAYWQFDKYVALSHFYRPVAWHAGGWTFAVYAHYDRSRFFNAHPKVFVTYRGGNNHKPAHFYADRHMPKPAVHHNAPAAHRPAPAVHHNTPVAHHNAPSPAPHNGKPAAAHNDRHGADRHMAMNNGHSNKGHFGGRR